MSITNQIRLAEVITVEGNYLKVKLLQVAAGSTDDENTIDEIMTGRINGGSQANPNAGDHVLIAFDNVGDLYYLKTIGSDNKATPDPDNPAYVIRTAGDLKETLQNDGKYSLNNVSEELIALLIDTLTEISSATVAPGGGPLLNAGAIAALIVRLQSFKV